jgi:hypothetical protein
MKNKKISILLSVGFCVAFNNCLLSQSNVSLNKYLPQSSIDLITQYVSAFPDHTQISIAFLHDHTIFSNLTQPFMAFGRSRLVNEW